MRKLRTLGIMAAMLAAGATAVTAQDKVEATASADFVSQYVWRGQDLGNISVQPSLGVSWKGLSLSAWGSVGFNSDDTKELDLTLAYSTGGFNIGVTDYWFNAGADPRYFYYNSSASSDLPTAHVFEANIGYDFGPVAVQWYTNFAGNDFKVNDEGENKHAYSSYVEVSAPFRLGGLDWLAAVGAVPYESSAIYSSTNGFAVTNVALKATKDIKVTDTFDIPVFASVSANPHTQKAYFVCGFTLRP